MSEDKKNTNQHPVGSQEWIADQNGFTRAEHLERINKRQEERVQVRETREKEREREEALKAAQPRKQYPIGSPEWIEDQQRFVITGI